MNPNPSSLSPRILLSQILNRYEESHSAELPDAWNYTSFLKRILRFELQNELAFLNQLVSQVSSYELLKQAVQERCAFRAMDEKMAIGFDKIPLSPANLMYGEIVDVLFAPRSLADRLKIILPQVTETLTIEFFAEQAASETTKRSRRVELAVENFSPKLIVTPVNQSELMTSPSSLENFLGCVVCGNQIMPLDVISLYSLQQLSKLAREIKQTNEKLYLKLFKHNQTFTTALRDIQTYNDRGMAPRRAFTEFTECLRVGGNRVFGQGEASSSATAAVARFKDYFNQLPGELKNQLLVLKHDGTLVQGKPLTLQRVFVEIEEGECVGTIAVHVSDILQANHAAPCLDVIPPEASLQIAQLIAKYDRNKNQSLDKQKSADEILIELPKHFAKIAIQEIKITTEHELVVILSYFVPALYDMLIEHLILIDAEMILNKIVELISNHNLTDEQKSMAQRAIAKHYQRFSLNLMELYAICGSEEGAWILRMAVMNIPKEQRFTVLQLSHPLLHDIAEKNLNLLLELIRLLPIADRCAAIRLQNKEHNSILHVAMSKPTIVLELLELIANEDYLSLLQTAGSGGNNLLHLAVEHPELLRQLLAPLTHDRLFDVLQIMNHKDQTFLALALAHPQSLAVILNWIPVEQRLAVLQLVDNAGMLMLHVIAQSPESLTLTLHSLADNERLPAVQMLGLDDASLLHYVTDFPELFTAILNLYPMDERFNAVTLPNSKNKTVLHKMAKKSDLYHDLLLSFLAHPNALTVVGSTDHKGNTFMHRIALDQQLLQVVLALFPDNPARFAVAEKSTSIENNTVFHLAVSNPQSVEMLLKVVPVDCLPILSKKNNQGETILHAAAKYPASFQLILQHLSEVQLLAALQFKGDYKGSVLEFASTNIENLEVIIQRFSENISVLKAWFDIALYNPYHTSETLKRIFQMYSIDEQVALLMSVDKNGYRLLERILSHGLLLEVFTPLNATQCFQIISFQDQNGHAILHSLINHAYRGQDAELVKSLAAILALIPNEHHVSLIEQQNHKQQNLIQLANTPEVIQFLLTIYPEERRWSALQLQSSRGNPVSSHVANTAESLITVLELLPEHVRYGALCDRSQACHNATPALLQTILNLLPPAQRVHAIQTVSYQYRTLIQKALDDVEVFENVIAFYTPAQLSNSLQTMRNSHEQTILHMVSLAPAVLQKVLSLLTDTQFYSLLQQRDSYGKTPLHIAVRQQDALNLMIIACRDRLDLLMDTLLMQDDQNDFPLGMGHYYYHTVLQRILLMLPQATLVDALRVKSKQYRETILHGIGFTPKSLAVLLPLIPPDLLPDLLAETNSRGETPLHTSTRKHQSFALLLARYAENARLPALAMKNKEGNTVLHDLVKGYQNNANTSMKLVLALLPKEQHQQAVALKDAQGNTLLHVVGELAPKLIKTILECAADTEQRVAMLLIANVKGERVLDCMIAKMDIQSLAMIATSLTKMQFLSLCQSVDKNGQTALHLAANTGDHNLFFSLLGFLPAESRLTELHRLDNLGNSVLHIAAKQGHLITAIIQLIPAADQSKAVCKTNRKGQTVLRQLHKIDEQLQQHVHARLLLTIAPQERLAALQIQDDKGTTALHSLNKIALVDILKVLPKEHRASAVIQAKDRCGGFLLHQLGHNNKLMCSIMKLLPIEKRLAVLMMDLGGVSALDKIIAFQEDCNQMLQLLPTEHAALFAKKLDGISICEQLDQARTRLFAKEWIKMQMILDAEQPSTAVFFANHHNVLKTKLNLATTSIEVGNIIREFSSQYPGSSLCLALQCYLPGNEQKSAAMMVD